MYQFTTPVICVTSATPTSTLASAAAKSTVLPLHKSSVSVIGTTAVQSSQQGPVISIIVKQGSAVKPKLQSSSVAPAPMPSVTHSVQLPFGSSPSKSAKAPPAGLNVPA